MTGMNDEQMTSLQEWASIRARAEVFKHSRPELPPDIDSELRDLESMGFEVADLLLRLAEEIDTAKQILSAELAQASLKFEAKGRTWTLVNRLAEAECAVQIAEVSKLQLAFDHARRLGRNLSAKHFGLMNTNKGIQGQVANYHRRSA